MVTMEGGSKTVCGTWMKESILEKTIRGVVSLSAVRGHYGGG